MPEQLTDRELKHLNMVFASRNADGYKNITPPITDTEKRKVANQETWRRLSVISPMMNPVLIQPLSPRAYDSLRYAKSPSDKNHEVPIHSGTNFAPNSGQLHQQKLLH